MNTKNPEKAKFHPPSVERWGSVYDLTAVGNTTEGEDEYPGASNPNSFGSNCTPPIANC